MQHFSDDNLFNQNCLCFSVDIHPAIKTLHSVIGIDLKIGIKTRKSNLMKPVVEEIFDWN